ncbi:MAG: undecaprenyl-diphosphate phosphatase [Salibacteraceae bacterium]
MTTAEALALGLIQGLTEFLPVSSSGHLELAKAIFGDDSLPAESLMFTVVLHFATALSTVVVFRKDIWSLIAGLFKRSEPDSFRFSVAIVISMIPAAFVGVMFDEQIETLFSGNIIFVGAMLIVTAALLFFADRAKSTGRNVGYFHALIIGIAQAIAILPGISRSGATISTSVLLGIDRERAARFSFLMVVPLIFGKMGRDLLSGEISTIEDQILPLSVGALAAFVAGLVACKWMIAVVKNSKLHFFSLYCLIVGLIAIAIAW